MLCVGTIAELVLMDGAPAARIICDAGAIPAPGQYLQASEVDGSAVLAASIFPARVLADGFIAEAPVPTAWRPGGRLNLRGALGHGFTLSTAARRVALIAWDRKPRRLLALVEAALQRDASVTLVCDNPPDDLPLAVEVQPLRALGEVCRWSDYAAFDLHRESLQSLRDTFGIGSKMSIGGYAEALVRVPMPCAGLAECGVCTVKAHRGSRLACVDGPVFDFELLGLKR